MLRRFRRLSIQDRIFIGVGVILLLMAAMFAVQTAASRAQAALSNRILARLLPARNSVRSASRWILRASDDGALYILADGASPQSAFPRYYRADLEHVRTDLLDAQRFSDLAQEDAFLDAFQRAWLRFEHNADDSFLLAARGRVQAARRQYVRASYQPALGVLAGFDRAISDEIVGARKNYQANQHMAETVGTSLSVSALGLGVIVAFHLGGSVRRRLMSVSNALSEVVHNDLAHMTASFREIAMGNVGAPRYVCRRNTLDEPSEPELAALVASYNGLIDALCEMSTRIDDAANDAQRRKEVEQRLIYLQHHDELTGLANRQLLQSHLDSAISLQRDRTMLAVAYIKLVGFKTIEDSFGHDAGNALIRLAADRLANALRGSDALARGGVDEFIVLLEPVVGAQDAHDRVTRLASSVSEAFVVSERNIFVRATAGVSVYPRDGNNAEELLRNAHTALERAEEALRTGVVAYAPEMRSESVQRLTVETDLQNAFKSGQFELHYQPIVNVRSARISGFEALLRWRHPTLGLLMPQTFIDVAESTGIIEQIGSWALHAACLQARSWRDQGYDVQVSVNVSMRQLYHGALFSAVNDALQQSHLAPEHLELELTESMILHHRESAVRALSALKHLGVHLAIDDFGTGYSWYGYLRYFSPDTLKLDRTFVANVNRNPLDESVAEAMIMLGHNLHLKVIAEGVEETSQMLTLHRLECDEMQGYLFAPPMMPADCDRLLREGLRKQPTTERLL